MMFSLTIVLFQLGTHLSGIGSLVYSSIFSVTLAGPAIIALVQALANFLALLISNLFSRYISPRTVFTGGVISAAFNAWASLLSEDINPYTLFVRLLLGTFSIGYLLSNGPRIISKDPQEGNQKVQILSSVSTLLGFGLAPIIASNPRLLFMIDACISLLALMLLLVVKSDFKDPNFIPRKANSQYDKESSWLVGIERNVLVASIATLLLWIFGGFFHVVEVPVLIHKFNLNNNQISGVFLATLVSSLATIYLANRSWISQQAKSILITTVVIIAAGCVGYLNAANLYQVIVMVSVIGIANGLFNLAQSASLQTIAEPQPRLNSFIFVRLTAQIGLMIGALAAGSEIFFSKSSLISNSQKNIFSATPQTVAVYLQSIPEHSEPYKNTDTASMLVLKQIYDNLFEYNSANTIQPKLISKIVWGKDYKSLLLTIRKDIDFTNGDPLTAEDVKASLSEAQRYLGGSGDWAFSAVKSFEVLDAKTLQINFKKPHTLFPAILAAPYFGIFKRGERGKIYGTAGYEIQSMSNTRIVLIRSEPKFQGPDKILFDSKIDPGMKYHITDTDISHGSLFFKKLNISTLQTIVLVPNMHNEIFKSKEYRCHVLQSFERLAPQVYTKWNPVNLGLAFSKDFFSRENSPVAKSIPSANDVSVIYADSVARFEDPLNRELTKRLRKLNVNASFTRYPIRELVSAGQSGTFVSLMFGFVPDFVHPYALISPLLGSNQQFNLGGYSNRDIDDLLVKAMATQNKVEQNHIFTKILSLAHKDCGIAFLGSQPSSIFYSSDLIQPEIGKLGIHNFQLSALKLRR